MGDVVSIGTETTIDLPIEKVLGAALEADLEQVILIGVTRGGEVYHASTTSDIPEMLFRAEMFKRQLLERAAQPD